MANLKIKLVKSLSGRNAKHIATANSLGLHKIGKLIGERAVAADITEVVFDRGGNVYHGRVKALAEGAREGGLKF